MVNHTTQNIVEGDEDEHMAATEFGNTQPFGNTQQPPGNDPGNMDQALKFCVEIPPVEEEDSKNALEKCQSSCDKKQEAKDKKEEKKKKDKKCQVIYNSIREKLKDEGCPATIKKHGSKKKSCTKKTPVKKTSTKKKKVTKKKSKSKKCKH